MPGIAFNTLVEFVENYTFHHSHRNSRGFKNEMKGANTANCRIGTIHSKELERPTRM